MRTVHTVIAAALLALSGCAALEGQEASDSEQILSQAGFRHESAAAAAAQGATSVPVQGMKVPQLVAENENGSPLYEFYDPKFCHCVYVGGPQEYARLQQLRGARRRA